MMEHMMSGRTQGLMDMAQAYGWQQPFQFFGAGDDAWKQQGLTTMGMNKGKSEFGILECPPQALVNRKRGAASMSAAAPAVASPGAGAGGLMTEEQALEFQKSLKRSRT